MNTKLAALMASCIIIGAGFGYLVSTTQMMMLQTEISQLETDTNAVKTAYNNLEAEHNQLRHNYDLLNATYNHLNDSLSEKTNTILLLQRQMSNLSQTYLLLLEHYENLRSRTTQRAMYVVEEAQNIKVDAVPAGVKRHYILINIPIPEDAGEDVVLIHYDQDNHQLAVPFYYFMDINATGKGVISSGYFPFPCQIIEYRIGENSPTGILYIQTIYTPTDQGYVCEAGDYLCVEFLTSPKGLAEVTVFYWDEKL